MFGRGGKPHDNVELLLQTSCQCPLTHSPISQPGFGMGRRPHDRAGDESHICCHWPFTHWPMRHPMLGIGRIPHVNSPKANTFVTPNSNNMMKKYFSVCFIFESYKNVHLLAVLLSRRY